MARRSDHSRDELKALTLDAAERLLARSGGQGISARQIATEIGYSPGTLYNLFADLDELLLHVAARTLDAMLEEAGSALTARDPEVALMQLAHFYFRFTRDHDAAWRLVVHYQMDAGRRLPNWYRARVGRVLAMVERAVDPLFAGRSRVERRLSALTLWAAMQGICSVGRSSAVAPNPERTVMALSQDLVTNYVAGMHARASAPLDSAA